MKYPKFYARLVASMLDHLGHEVPTLAAECSMLAEKIREWAGPEVSAGPSDPIDPPKGP